MYLSRHGTANDEDEVWANFTCGEPVRNVFLSWIFSSKALIDTKIEYSLDICDSYLPFQSPGVTCKDEHIRQDGVDDDGRVCHCYDDFCNKEVPAPEPEPGTTCDTTCTTECSDMDDFHGLKSDATCSTACKTTCYDNQGINGKYESFFCNCLE